MSPRRLLAAIVALVALLALWHYLRSGLDYLLVNKATYLLNTGEVERGREIAQSVAARRPQMQSARFIAGRSLIATGEFREALRQLEPLPEQSDVSYWRGIASYQLGETTTALRHFANAAEPKERAALGSHADRVEASRLATALIGGEGNGSSTQQIMARSFGSDDMIISALVGRIEYSSGRWRNAAKMLLGALAHGDRNPETPILACSAALFAGNEMDAARLMDFADDHAAFARQVTAETAKRRAADGMTSSIEINGLMRHRENSLQACRSLAWLEIRKARRQGTERHYDAAVSALDSDLAQYPEDPLLRLLRVQAFTGAGRDREAYQELVSLTDNGSNLSLLLRKRDLEADWDAMRADLIGFAEGLSGAQLLLPDDFHGDGSARTWTRVFLEDGGISTSVTVTARNRVAYLIAAADSAFGAGPSVTVLADGKHLGDAYMYGDGPQPYRLPFLLPEGESSLRIDVHLTRSGDHASEKRSLRFMGLLISSESATGVEAYD